MFFRLKKEQLGFSVLQMSESFLELRKTLNIKYKLIIFNDEGRLRGLHCMMIVSNTEQVHLQDVLTN